MKCDEQTWQQKQIGLEASDLRERLLDSHYGRCLSTLIDIKLFFCIVFFAHCEIASLSSCASFISVQ